MVARTSLAIAFIAFISMGCVCGNPFQKQVAPAPPAEPVAVAAIDPQPAEKKAEPKPEIKAVVIIEKKPIAIPPEPEKKPEPKKTPEPIEKKKEPVQPKDYIGPIKKTEKGVSYSLVIEDQGSFGDHFYRVDRVTTTNSVILKAGPSFRFEVIGLSTSELVDGAQIQMTGQWYVSRTIKTDGRTLHMVVPVKKTGAAFKLK